MAPRTKKAVQPVPAPLPDMTCQNCRHYHKNLEGDPNYGYCWRYPAVIVIVNGQAGYARPVMEKTETCGEFMPHLNS